MARKLSAHREEPYLLLCAALYAALVEGVDRQSLAPRAYFCLEVTPLCRKVVGSSVRRLVSRYGPNVDEEGLWLLRAPLDEVGRLIGEDVRGESAQGGPISVFVDVLVGSTGLLHQDEHKARALCGGLLDGSLCALGDAHASEHRGPSTL